MNTWIPVNERQPETQGEYLVANFNVQWVAMWDGATWLDYDFMTPGIKSRYIDMGSVPYFWMPLPELPKEEI